MGCTVCAREHGCVYYLSFIIETYMGGIIVGNSRYTNCTLLYVPVEWSWTFGVFIWGVALFFGHGRIGDAGYLLSGALLFHRKFLNQDLL